MNPYNGYMSGANYHFSRADQEFDEKVQRALIDGLKFVGKSAATAVVTALAIKLSPLLAANPGLAGTAIKAIISAIASGANPVAAGIAAGLDKGLTEKVVNYILEKLF